MGDFVVECPAVDAFGFDVDVLRLEEDERERFEHRFDEIRQSVLVAPVGDHVHASPAFIHFHEDDSRFLSGDVVQVDGHVGSFLRIVFA